MKVRIRLFATLKKYAPSNEGSEFELAFQGEHTVADISDRLKMPDSIESVVLLNGRHAESKSILSDGDLVTIYPTITGG